MIFTTALWTRKAHELHENPHVALVVHWPSLGRQINVAGRAELAERALAEELCARRDRAHQLQAMVSRQGEPIPDWQSSGPGSRTSARRWPMTRPMPLRLGRDPHARTPSSTGQQPPTPYTNESCSTTSTAAGA